MSDKIDEVLDARNVVLDEWDEAAEQLTVGFFEQLRARGHKPEWYILEDATIEDDGTITFRWAVRPEVEAMLERIARGEKPKLDA